MGKKPDASDRVALGGLSLTDALSGLLSIPNPDATKPKHEKANRKKVPPAKKVQWGQQTFRRVQLGRFGPNIYAIAATMVEIQIADELGGEPKRDSYWDSLGGVLVSSPTYSYKNIK